MFMAVDAVADRYVIALVLKILLYEFGIITH